MSATVQPRRVRIRLAVLACLAAVVACTTVTRDPALVNAPFTIRGITVPPEQLNDYLAKQRGFTSAGGAMRCAYTPLGQSDTRLFVWALCLERRQPNGAENPDSGAALSAPAAFTVQLDGSKTRVTGVELPDDGSGYEQSIERIFPASVRPSVNLEPKYHDRRLAAMMQHLIDN